MENEKKSRLNSETIWQYGTKVSWIVKSGNYENSWIVKWYGNYGRKVSWIVKRYGNYGRKVSWIVKDMENWRKVQWKDMENMEEKLNSGYGKYGRKVSWIVKRLWKIIERKVFGWIVKRYGKYGRNVSWMWKDMEIWKKSKLNSEKIWKIWKKSKLNSEKIWKLWKKSKLNSEKIWKIQKKTVKRKDLENMEESKLNVKWLENM